MMPLEAAGSRQHEPTSALATGFATALLALAYLLPNHAPPWMSFMQESVAAASLIVLVACALALERGAIGWRLPEIFVLCLLVVPPVHYLLGKIAFLQTAWMHELYLLGLLLCLLAGAALERRSPLRVLWVVTGAVWIAGMVSVGIQLYQWLALSPGEGTAWIYRSIGRPAANLGQPNSVGTLLVVALLSTYWFWRRAVFGPATALASALFLLFGLALTQSRTGLLNATVVAAAIVLWHRARVPRRSTLSIVGLTVCLLALFAGYAEISRLAGLPIDPRMVAERANVGPRPMAWGMFSAAVMERPFWGHGWGQSFVAQMNQTLQLPAQQRVFLSAHNLFLELGVWAGLPIAIAAAAALVLWLRACLRRVDDDGTMLLLLFVVAVLVHAMLEYPLAYAYFLLPAGLAAGALNQRVRLAVIWRAPGWLGAGLLSMAILACGVTVRDYLRVEQSYRDLLFEKARFASRTSGAAPDVLALTSLRDLIDFSRLAPRAGMSEGQIAWMGDVASTHPGATGFYKVAMAMVLNGQSEQAQHWVNMLCSIFPQAQCAAMADEWSSAARNHPAMRSIEWP